MRGHDEVEGPGLPREEEGHRAREAAEAGAPVGREREEEAHHEAVEGDQDDERPLQRRQPSGGLAKPVGPRPPSEGRIDLGGAAHQMSGESGRAPALGGPAQALELLQHLCRPRPGTAARSAGLRRTPMAVVSGHRAHEQHLARARAPRTRQ